MPLILSLTQAEAGGSEFKASLIKTVGSEKPGLLHRETKQKMWEAVFSFVCICSNLDSLNTPSWTKDGLELFLPLSPQCSNYKSRPCTFHEVCLRVKFVQFKLRLVAYFCHLMKPTVFCVALAVLELLDLLYIQISCLPSAEIKDCARVKQQFYNKFI